MRKTLLALAALATVAWPETLVRGRRSLVLDGKAAQLVVDLAGGSLVDFHLQDQMLSPLAWEEPGAPTAPRPMGHFLCLDRWGAPSDAEKRNGMPFHGEAARVEWKTVEEPHAANGGVEARMSAELPIAKIAIERRIRLSDAQPVFVVTEMVTNRNLLGRIYNMVQHATIGPPFLDESTLVDANAGRGFMQSSPLPNPEQPSVTWPQALQNGRPVDMRRLVNDPNPNVVSYIIEGEYGWTTASNATRGLLIGYVWKTSDYPWFNAWRHVENGKPFARGLEFGTTGLHQPYPILVRKGRIFDHPLFVYLDAGQSVTRSYAGFLCRIPKDYRGVARIDVSPGRLVLHERESGPQRDLTVTLAPVTLP
jgi:hypothetical protein